MCTLEIFILERKKSRHPGEFISTDVVAAAGAATKFVVWSKSLESLVEVGKL
jgi:hypothetical protein